MSDNRTTMPKDSHGDTVHRAMGIPLVADSIILGSGSVYVDIFNLTAYPSRVFTGISIHNPSGSVIHVCIGGDFASSKDISCPGNSDQTFDGQTFGAGFFDVELGSHVRKLRAKLAALSGTLATGTFNYDNGGSPVQPANGDLVTINSTVYEFSDDASAQPGRQYVQIGGSADASWSNLLSAVNAYDQAVTLSINTGTNIVTVTSNYGGTQGNAIGISTAIAGVVVSGATLAGGAGGVTPTIHIW